MASLAGETAMAVLWAALETAEARWAAQWGSLRVDTAPEVLMGWVSG
jgi:hypothetical protein